MDMFGLPKAPPRPKVYLTDHEVEMLRVLHERDGIGYRRLAAMFEVSRDTVRSICLYRRR